MKGLPGRKSKMRGNLATLSDDPLIAQGRDERGHTPPKPQNVCSGAMSVPPAYRQNLLSNWDNYIIITHIMLLIINNVTGSFRID